MTEPNEQYTGTYIAGKRETANVGSKKQIEKDRSEWIIFPNSHPPIVNQEEFERLQTILKSPKEALSSGRERSSHAKKLYAGIESGERKPAVTLYGYRINSSKALEAASAFEIDETAAEAVKMIFDLALRGFTAREIVEELQKARHISPGEYFKIQRGLNIQPTYCWPTLRIREILKNEQYTGAYIAGKTYQDKSGRKYHTPESEWIIIPDKHPAIVSKEAFEQVQALSSQGRRKMQPHNYLLKSKILCGTCGRSMIYGNTTTQPMYCCMATHADPLAACHKLKVSTDEVDDAVMAIIKKQAEVVLNSDDLSGFRKTTVSEKRFDGSVVQLNNADIEKQINLLSKERQVCYERFVSLEIDRDTFRLLKADYTKQIDRLTQQLAVSQQSARKLEADKKNAALAKDALSETATDKDIVDALVERVLVFPCNHIEIHWKFADFGAVKQKGK